MSFSSACSVHILKCGKACADGTSIFCCRVCWHIGVDLHRKCTFIRRTSMFPSPLKLNRVSHQAKCLVENPAGNLRIVKPPHLVTNYLLAYFSIVREKGLTHRVPTPSHLPLCVAKAGRNHLNEDITPLLPTGIGERYSQTISTLGLAARRCELLHFKRKCWTNSGGPLVNFRVADPDPDLHGSALIWVAGSGSGSRREKITFKKRKKLTNFMFWIAGLKASPVAWASFIEA